ncbi:MAG TPA: TolC family protein [Paraburkholderia sp.]|jgi:outer membrane protein TolC|uniref:TolC family protein n=1 Tax=Paraburkholderia sp. TaxID=1926495 RepID=UPI002DED06B0|nr:TolC family protein [Trinickia sp.]HEV3429268.1 TolC family protein [Paraburkholderia sp.]
MSARPFTDFLSSEKRSTVVKSLSLAVRAPRPTLVALSVAMLWLSGCAIKPTPFTDAERAQTAQADRTSMFANQQPVSGPISLDEAMARAIRYNLDHRLKMMEEALAQHQLDLSNFDLLPRLTAQAGYTNRNHPLASSSQGLYTNEQSLIPSYSTDQNDRTADLTLSWNLLDFGVSYYEAKEQADRVLVLEQRRRKVVQLMMQQVREAYWQAVGAQRLRDRIGPLLDQAHAALDDSRAAQQQGLRSPIDTLNYQHALLDLMRQLEAVRDQLEEAKPRLASLMNLEPGKDYTLAATEAFAVPQFDMAMPQMEDMALQRRPELVEAGYNERISVNETHKAMAKMLPGVELEIGGHYDSNSFLVYNAWRAAGISVSWNLLNLLNYKAIHGTAQAQLDVAKTQRMALSMAVLTQVHVARSELGAKERQFTLLKQLNDVDQQILQHTHNATQANAQGKLEEIRVATGAMMSELRLYQSYGELESAYGQMLATLGLDPVPDSVHAHDIASLKQSIADEQKRWDLLAHGGLPDVTQPGPTTTAATAAAAAAGVSQQ